MIFNLVIPMAGLGKRFVAAGYTKPKPFISLGADVMIGCVMRNLASGFHRPRITWIIHPEHEHIARLYAEKLGVANVVVAPGLTGGAAATVLLASHLFNDKTPLVVANSDQLVDGGLDAFLNDAIQRDLDGSILVFKNDDPKWSYVRLDENQMVVEVAEKNPIGPYATVGIYYWKHGGACVEFIASMIARQAKSKGEYYLAPSYNEMILQTSQRIGIFEIKPEQMHGLGTPEDLAAYKEQAGHD